MKMASSGVDFAIVSIQIGPPSRIAPRDASWAYDYRGNGVRVAFKPQGLYREQITLGPIPPANAGCFSHATSSSAD